MDFPKLSSSLNHSLAKMFPNAPVCRQFSGHGFTKTYFSCLFSPGLTDFAFICSFRIIDNNYSKIICYMKFYIIDIKLRERSWKNFQNLFLKEMFERVKLPLETLIKRNMCKFKFDKLTNSKSKCTITSLYKVYP